MKKMLKSARKSADWLKKIAKQLSKRDNAKPETLKSTENFEKGKKPSSKKNMT